MASIRSPRGPKVPSAGGATPGHTVLVKAAVLLALLLAIPADARTPRRVPNAIAGSVPDPNAGFWRDILEPHSEQVHHLLAVARNMQQQADSAQYGDYDPTGEQRARYYVQIFGIMRYAHRLAPENLEVMRLLGEAADQLGRTRQALDVLEAAVRLVGPERAGPEITGRLGGIYLRLGRTDDAIRYLRIAQGPVTPANPISAQVVVWLADALAARGELDEAIDVLSTSLPQNVPFYSNEVALVGFALAVQYDRDDQRGAAFEMLDRMENALQAQTFAGQVQNGLAFMRWAPPEDQHYYQALLYETMGHYTEARAEWALYAAAGDLPFRARALEHIAAIDKQRATNTVSVPPAFVPRRYRHHPPPPPSPTP